MTAPKRILIVDDSIDAAESLAALLEIDGHLTQVAHSGPDALAVVQSFVPDLAFIDIGMPGMDGYELAAALRAMPALRRMSLVALSGWGAHKNGQQAGASGFDQHLTKPAELNAIYGVLAGLDQLR